MNTPPSSSFNCRVGIARRNVATQLELGVATTPISDALPGLSKEVELIPKESGDTLLQRLWLELRQRWFPEQPVLDHYLVRWSKRAQIRTLASCSVSCRHVTVARELNYQQHWRWLEPLLYHEMCHAALGIDRTVAGKRSPRRVCHGRSFRALERKHPGTAALDAWIKSGGWLSAVRSDHIRRGKKRHDRHGKKNSASHIRQHALGGQAVATRWPFQRRTPWSRTIWGRVMMILDRVSGYRKR